MKLFIGLVFGLMGISNNILVAVHNNHQFIIQPEISTNNTPLFSNIFPIIALQNGSKNSFFLTIENRNKFFFALFFLIFDVISLFFIQSGFISGLIFKEKSFTRTVNDLEKHQGIFMIIYFFMIINIIFKSLYGFYYFLFFQKKINKSIINQSLYWQWKFKNHKNIFFYDYSVLSCYLGLMILQWIFAFKVMDKINYDQKINKEKINIRGIQSRKDFFQFLLFLNVFLLCDYGLFYFFYNILEIKQVLLINNLSNSFLVKPLPNVFLIRFLEPMNSNHYEKIIENTNIFLNHKDIFILNTDFLDLMEQLSNNLQYLDNSFFYSQQTKKVLVWFKQEKVF